MHIKDQQPRPVVKTSVRNQREFQHRFAKTKGEFKSKQKK